jgi:hypothetical protein
LPPLAALVYHRRGVTMWRCATRRWMALLALAGSVAAAAPAGAQAQVAWAAFGLTGVGH